MRARIICVLVLSGAAASRCGIPGPVDSGYCDMSPCGLTSGNWVPDGRSAVCDYDRPDTPDRRDHCLVWDGMDRGLWLYPYGVAIENCCEAGATRDDGEIVCTPLKDPIVGGDVTTCDVDGVPARCMWIPLQWIETYPPPG